DDAFQALIAAIAVVGAAGCDR
ncbi:unnamed protein product, partial [Oikopleura dioica]